MPAAESASTPYATSLQPAGQKVVNFAQVMKELGWSRGRLSAMQFNCPYLDEGVLVFRQEPRWGPPGPGRRLFVRVLPESTLAELKRKAQEVREGRFRHRGVYYLSPARALRELRIAGDAALRGLRGRGAKAPPAVRNSLSKWHRRGCPHLAGERLAAKLFKFGDNGPPQLWPLEEHILRIKASLLGAVRANQESLGSFPGALRRLRRQAGLTTAELAAKSGICRASISAWESGHKRPRPDKAQALAEALGVTADALRLPRRAAERSPRPQSRFDGVFRDAAGRVVGYSLRKASRVSRIGHHTLGRYAVRLPEHFRGIFAEGFLPSRPMLVPGTEKCWQNAVSPEDLKSLTTGIAEVLRRDAQRLKGPLHHFLTGEQVCERHGVTGAGARIVVGSLLVALRRRGVLPAQRVVLEKPGHKQWWRPAWVYDPAGLEQFLAGRSLVEVARKCAVEPDVVATTGSAGEQRDPEVSAGGARRAGRGRKASSRRREMFRFCYTELRVTGRKRLVVFREAQAMFGKDGPKSEAEVSTYASRYARAEERRRAGRAR
jgi:transcriptional regulator with XRE-family HTH domain